MYERKDHQTIVRDGNLFLFGGVNQYNEVLGKVWKQNGSDWNWQYTDREDLFKQRNKLIAWDYGGTDYILSIGGRDNNHNLTEDI